MLSAVILVEDQLLVGKRLGDDDRGPERRHRRRGRPIDALDQLQVVAADHVQRQVALDADGELGEDVLVLLDGERSGEHAHAPRSASRS